MHDSIVLLAERMLDVSNAEALPDDHPMSDGRSVAGGHPKALWSQCPREGALCQYAGITRPYALIY